MLYCKILVYLVIIEIFYDFNDFGLKYSFELVNIFFIFMFLYLLV